MSLRLEFVIKAQEEGANMAALCREYHISRKTGYKWLSRYDPKNPQSLDDLSTRPAGSPGRTPDWLRQLVLAVRLANPAWGGRKIRRHLFNQGIRTLPSPSTITTILHQAEAIDPEEAAKHRSYCRFEREFPNELWQMDHRSPLALGDGRCYPLTVLDDCSRFLLGLRASPDQTRHAVQTHLTDIFRLYGLPTAILTDNGPPWGYDREHPHTALTIWLLHLDVMVLHSRPYHPQTLGKGERFHRTLKAELLRDAHWPDLAVAQTHFDRFRTFYNEVRPHESLDMDVPASRYHPSHRTFPETLPAIEYQPGDVVRKVTAEGRVTLGNRRFRVSKGLRGYPVALREGPEEGLLTVYFRHYVVGQIDLHSPSDVD